MNELVICRYREDVSWAMRWADKCVITVYDKGDDDLDGSQFPAFRWIKMKNEGRESDAFLRHILSRYPDFPEVTVFAQGYPFDHVATPWYFRMVDKLVDVQSIDGSGYVGMSRLWGDIVDYECEKHKDLPIRRFCEAAGMSGNWRCNYCAHFAVTKSALLRNPKERYEVLLDLLFETDTIDVTESHVEIPTTVPVHEGVFVIERLWSRLFS